MNPRRRDHFRSVSRRRYERRPFRNPYFVKSVQVIPWKIVLPLLGVLLLLVSGFSYLFRAERFAITEVHVVGTASIASSDVEAIVRTYLEERRWIFFHRNNRFLFNANLLRERLRLSYVFEGLDLKQEGKGITIAVKEKPTPFLWETDGILWLLAEDGSAVRALTAEERARVEDAWNGREMIVIDPASGETGNTPPPDPFASLPHHVNTQDKPLHPGDIAISPETSERIRTFLDRLMGIGITIREIRVDAEVGSWMEGKTTDRFSILFDPALDVLTQANNLKTLLTQTVTDRSRLEYVDVRFGERVYYKLLP